MSELNSEQRNILKGIQERRTIDNISENLDFEERTVYYAIKGMSSSHADKTPRKWVTEKDYLFRKNVQGLRNNYFLTPQGMREIENLDVQLDKEESRSKDLRECEFCGFEDEDCLHEHHIIPRSQGGTDDQSNIVVLCANCHAKVHKLILDEVHPVKALNKVGSSKISSVKKSMRVD